jgi:hypothetical protein
MNSFGQLHLMLKLKKVLFQISVTQIFNGTLANITLDDVLFRNVWVCSGQSDVELAVSQIFNGSLSPTVFASNSYNLVVRPLMQ